MRVGMHAFHALAAVVTLAGAPAAQDTDPLALVNRARQLNREGHQDDALRLYREALREAPDSFDAHYGAGIVLDLQGAYRDARAEFTRAIELATTDTKLQALTGMAVSCAFDGRVADAGRFYQQVFDAQMATEGYAGAAETANALGRVYLESGDLPAASRWYQTGYETARRQPDIPGSQLDLAALRWAHAQARIAARRGRSSEARMHLAELKALIDKGSNPEQQDQYPYAVGYVDFHLKDYAGAIAALHNADQTDPFILVLLAQATEKAGQRAEAERLYEQTMMQNGHSLNNAFARPLARRKVARVGQKTE